MELKELFGFEGKNVVITGAGSGMGYAARPGITNALDFAELRGES